MRAGLLVVAGAVLGPGAALAQEDCHPDPDSNEARTLAIFSVPLVLGPLDPPVTGEGRLRVSLEGSYLPEVDRETAAPTTCRPGKGPENTDLLFGFLRPRVTLRLSRTLTVDAAWVPPIRINEVKANLFGLALTWTREVRPGMTLGIRGHTTLGQINAPITCPEEALADPLSECFQGTESDDRFRPNIYGVDARVGFRAGTRWRPYAGVGYNRLQPRFRVHFVNSLGELDNRRVTVDLNRVVVFGGVAWQASRSFGLVGEVYSAPADATTGRLALHVSP